MMLCVRAWCTSSSPSLLCVLLSHERARTGRGAASTTSASACYMKMFAFPSLSSPLYSLNDTQPAASGAFKGDSCQPTTNRSSVQANICLYAHKRNEEDQRPSIQRASSLEEEDVKNFFFLLRKAFDKARHAHLASLLGRTALSTTWVNPSTRVRKDVRRARGWGCVVAFLFFPLGFRESGTHSLSIAFHNP